MTCTRRVFRLLVVMSVSVAMLASLTKALPQRAARQRALATGRPTTQWLCQRDECQCSEDDTGLEMVDCDCTKAEQQQALLLGDLSAFVSGRTLSLHVQHCDAVILQSQALSQAVSLKQLRFSDINTLHLQPLSIYTNNGPAKTVVFESVANLTVEPGAFQQVQVLEKLEFANVTAETLPEGLFGLRTDVIDFKLKDSDIEVMEDLRLPKADNVTVENCRIGELNMDVEDVLSVNIRANTIDMVGMLHFNVQPNFHSSENKSVYINNNNITAMESDSMEVIANKFHLLNNTIEKLTGPLRVSFIEAHVMGNTFNELSPASFAAMRQTDPINVRFRFLNQPEPAPFALVFAGNTMAAPSENGTFGLVLYPDDLDTTNTLFHVYNNRFVCGCSALQELVELGDRAFLAAANMTDSPAEDDEDPVVDAQELARVLYTSSRCEDDRPLSQFRLTAYNSDYTCLQEDKMTGKPSTASAAAGALTLLMAATTAATMLA